MLVHDSMTDDSSFYISHTRVGVYILGIYLSSVILKTSSIASGCYPDIHSETSSIRSDVIRHPPYNGLIAAYSAVIYITTSLPLRNVRELFINLLNPLQRVKRRSLTSGRKNVFLRTEEREHGERSIERRSRESF